MNKFKVARKRRLLIYMIAEMLILIGSIMFIRNVDAGIIVGCVGLGFLLVGFIFHHSKYYQNLAKAEENAPSFKQIVDEFGLPMTIFGLLFIFALFFGGIFIMYFLSHSWIKTILFMIAFFFVSNMRSFFNIEKDD